MSHLRTAILADPPNPLDSLSPPECRSWLASHGQGRLAYRSGVGDRAVVVRYALAGDEVVFRMPEYSPVLGYALGAQVTLEVEECTGDDRAEVVWVTGTAHAPTDEDTLLSRVTPVESWPPGVSTHLVCLPMTDVEGMVFPARPGPVSVASPSQTGPANTCVRRDATAPDRGDAGCVLPGSSTAPTRLVAAGARRPWAE
jgi:hypothetical protein